MRQLVSSLLLFQLLLQLLSACWPFSLRFFQLARDMVPGRYGSYIFAFLKSIGEQKAYHCPAQHQLWKPQRKILGGLARAVYHFLDQNSHLRRYRILIDLA